MSTYHVTVNGQIYSVDLKARKGTALTFAVAGTEYLVSVEQAFRPSFTQASSTTALPVTLSTTQPVAAAAHEVRSPIPGIVSDLKVAPGDSVEVGATLVVIEAMKMENAIKAHCSGIIAEVHVTKGQEVGNAVLLISFKKTAQNRS
jgi:biotin carboxyl carrier protein